MRTAAIVLGASGLWLAATVAQAQLGIGTEAAGHVTGAGKAVGAAAGGGVTGAAAGAAASASVDAQIQGTLDQQMRLPGVTAQIRDGVATLTGKVASQAEKDRMGQLASSVDGVSRVRNQLTVDAASAAGRATGAAAAGASGAAAAGRNASAAGQVTGSATGQADASHGASPALNTSVLTALNGDARFAGKGINVSANGSGVVTLTGMVPTEADKMAAGRIAANTKLVTDVNNRLTVTK